MTGASRSSRSFRWKPSLRVSWNTRSPLAYARGSVPIFVELLGYVVFEAHFGQSVKLALDVIDVILFVGEDFFEERAGGVVAGFCGELDGAVQLLNRGELERHVVLQLRLDVLADFDGADVGHVGSSFQEQNARHELLGVFHFVDRLLAIGVAQAEIAPVLAHLGMQKILIDGRQLGLQGFTQLLEDFDVSLHAKILTRNRHARMAAEMKKLAFAIAMLAFTASNIPDLAQLKKMTERFAPTELRVDLSKLSPGDRKALVKLIEPSRVLDDICLKQLWSGNQALDAKLRRDPTPLGKARLHYFWIHNGATSDLDQHAAFLPDVPEKKLPGPNFHPEDHTRAG